MDKQIKQNRDFMKCPSFGAAMDKSDQSLGKPHPPHGKDVKGEKVNLPPFKEDAFTNLLDIRRSLRKYDENKPMTQEQLAYILHSAQGIQEYRGNNEAFTLRPAPSGGARHPFETYIAVQNVEGLQAGLYYYAPTANVGQKKVTLVYMGAIEDYKEQITAALVGQSWAAKAPVVLFLTCVAYRAEWRYKEHAHRVVLIDLGHVGQNIMLSAANLGLGSCCMAAYDQVLCDEMLNVDGLDEYTVYAVAVGGS